MKWWESKKKEDNSEEEITLPPEIQAQLDQAKEATTKLTALESKFDTFLEAQRLEREERTKPKPKPAKTQEELEAEDEEITALLISNPRAAYEKLAEKTNSALLMTRADNLRREVFEDNAEKFPFYTGDIKVEINKILAQESLGFRNNPQALENTYYTVVGKRQKDIEEGKIKSRFATSTASRTTAEDEASKRKLEGNADTEKIAKMLGMKHDEYLKLLEEDVEAYI